MIPLDEDRLREPPSSIWRRRLALAGPTFLVSALFHGMLAVILAMMVYGSMAEEPIFTLLVMDPVPEPTAPAEVKLEPLPVDVPAGEVAPLSVRAPEPELAGGGSLALPADFSLKVTERLDAIADPTFGYSKRLRQSFEGRRGEMRAQLVQEHGGTPESELAVLEGLKWLARHQRSDGGWSFDHRCPDCDGTCDGPGAESVRHWTSGATALAILCFLGAGHTHMEGDYQDEVRAGLRYLLSQRGPTRAGGDYTKSGTHPGLYVQGFVGIALAEAYAMTKDDFVRPPAIAALDFIADAQDPKGGGWRYVPRMGGDTSVVGWQVMALTSGRIAGLGTWRLQRGRTAKFLDSVQSHGGSRYGYIAPQRYGGQPSTTAIGLLCRMYHGWNNRAALADGVEFLSDHGPEPRNMYYNYYATQVLHHWGGEKWKKWNERMRTQLVSTQTRTGHGTGSWDPAYCRWADPQRGGGRLFVTCLSILTLEVYYRHLPLYQEKAAWDREKK